MKEIKIRKIVNRGVMLTNEYQNIIYSVSSAERFYILPGERRKVNVSIEVELPEEYIGLILPRKEIYFRYGISTLSDILYPSEKKELQIYLTNVNVPKSPINLSDYERFAGDKSRVEIYIGDKIANMILVPATTFNIKEIA